MQLRDDLPSFCVQSPEQCLGANVVSQNFQIENLAYLAENDGRIDCKHSVELEKCLIFRFLTIAVKEELLNTLHCKLFVFQGNHISLGSKEIGEFEDMIGECG